MSNKIYLCTTFRDFNGSLNDELQKSFLRSIKEQTYDNFELVVTMFGEKKVEENVKEILGDKAFFIDEGKKEYKYSLSTVFLNGMERAKTEKDSILIWSTSDIVLEQNYFEIIVSNYHHSLAGITHPNHYTDSYSEESKKDSRLGDLLTGIDILFFSTELLRQEKCRKAIENYTFYGWGVFENFLATVGAENAVKRINTVNISNVYKVCNDREAANETNTMLNAASMKNFSVFLKYLQAYQYSDRYRYLLFCHRKYSILRKNRSYNRMKYRWNKEKMMHSIYCSIPDRLYKLMKRK